MYKFVMPLLNKCYLFFISSSMVDLTVLIKFTYQCKQMCTVHSVQLMVRPVQFVAFIFQINVNTL